MGWAICIKNFTDLRLQINNFNNKMQGHIVSIRNNIAYIKTDNYLNAVCKLSDIDIDKLNIGQRITFQYDFSIEPLFRRQLLCYYRKYFFIKHIHYL